MKVNKKMFPKARSLIVNDDAFSAPTALFMIMLSLMLFIFLLFISTTFTETNGFKNDCEYQVNKMCAEISNDVYSSVTENFTESNLSYVDLINENENKYTQLFYSGLREINNYNAEKKKYEGLFYQVNESNIKLSITPNDEIAAVDYDVKANIQIKLNLPFVGNYVFDFQQVDFHGTYRFKSSDGLDEDITTENTTDKYDFDRDGGINREY